ncbi:alpha/beta fold hydrolase [Streptomyces sp. NPDC048603]|uniref:alpha/beta fold hydrolase n=1 Tax=Streptomyces sp. NPDC048603 TaxID=3365577 RepID=UPI00371E74DA
MTAVTSETAVSADGTVIAFDRRGAGPALVLVSGAFGVREDPRWRELAEELAGRFTVVAYDRRGRGDSGDSGGAGDTGEGGSAARYDVRREVEDLSAVIAAVGGTAYLFGISSGAVLALEAVARGAAVTRLALYEPPFVVDGSRPPVPADYLDRLTALLAGGSRGDMVEYFMTAAVGVPAEYLGGMRQDPSWGFMESVAHTLPYDAAAMGDTMRGRPLPEGRWSPVSVPVLVADGDASFPWIHAAADALAGVLPGAVRRTLEGQDHGVEAKAVAPVLAEFFGPDGEEEER